MQFLNQIQIMMSRVSQQPLSDVKPHHNHLLLSSFLPDTTYDVPCLTTTTFWRKVSPKPPSANPFLTRSNLWWPVSHNNHFLTSSVTITTFCYPVSYQIQLLMSNVLPKSISGVKFHHNLLLLSSFLSDPTSNVQCLTKINFWRQVSP